MDLQPWNYYDEQLQPKGHTAEIVSTLESVMARNPDHPGALPCTCMQSRPPRIRSAASRPPIDCAS